MKRRILSLVLCLMLLGTLVLTAYAVEIPDYDRKGSITVTMTHKGKPVPGGSLTLYRVADVNDYDGNFFFTYTEDFADCSIPVDDPSVSELATELTRIVVEKKLTGITKQIGQNGTVTFGDLEIGLYLLVQTFPAMGYNFASPFLVSVPNRVEERYVYDVDASPKVELEPSPTVPTEPDDDKLPQTGQVNWPVPALAAAGLFLLVLGKWLWSTGRKKQNET